MQTTVVTVIHPVGLHARPASLFVNLAKSHKSSVQIRNLTANGEWSNAKSILGVLTLGVEKDHQIEIKTEGPDEEQAIRALEDLVNTNFGGEV